MARLSRKGNPLEQAKRLTDPSVIPNGITIEYRKDIDAFVAVDLQRDKAVVVSKPRDHVCKWTNPARVMASVVRRKLKEPN